MKLIVLMSLAQYKDQVRQLFERHQVHIYSEVEMVGHTADTIKKYGWWSFEKDLPRYSTLYFAAVPREIADQIMRDLEHSKQQWDPEHPPRALQVNVERMI